MNLLTSIAAATILLVGAGSANAQYYNGGSQVYQNGHTYQVDQNGNYYQVDQNRGYSTQQYYPCTGRSYDTRTNTAGPIIGALIGGLAGNQIGDGRGRTAATVGGVILGGVVGNHIQDRNNTTRCSHVQQYPQRGYSYSTGNNQDGDDNDDNRYYQQDDRYTNRGQYNKCMRHAQYHASQYGDWYTQQSILRQAQQRCSRGW